MTNFQRLINNSIKQLRINSGLTQEKFCEKCELNVTNYRNLEYNRQMPKSQTIDKICSAFNITIVELLQLTNAESGLKDRIKIALNGLSDTQLCMVEDFIKTIRSHKI